MKPAPIFANAVVIAVALCAAVLHELNPDWYFVAVQEDRFLEWATFWSFLAAAALLLKATWEGASFKAGWCLLLTAAFCLFVAFEEISWGQRVFGYRPPETFLANNFQQELNLHNIVDAGFRTFAMYGLTLGFGVLLPLLARAKAVGDRFSAWHVLVPPAWLIPAMGVTGIFWGADSLPFTAEWGESMLGLCFLFVALDQAKSDSAAAVISAVAFVAAAALASALLSQNRFMDDPEKTVRAKSELEALARDIKQRDIDIQCALHTRVYSLVTDFGQEVLLDGEYAAMAKTKEQAERMGYFLDPWNYSYWVRHVCTPQGKVVTTFVYSFGPNQIRDAMSADDLGDDILVYAR